MRKLSCLGYCFHESRDSWLSEQLPSCLELVKSNQIDVLRVGKILSRVQMLIQQCCRPDILVKALANKETNHCIIELAKSYLARYTIIKKGPESRDKGKDQHLLMNVLDSKISLETFIDDLMSNKISLSTMNHFSNSIKLISSVNVNSGMNWKVRFLVHARSDARKEFLKRIEMAVVLIFHKGNMAINLSVFKELL